MNKILVFSILLMLSTACLGQSKQLELGDPAPVFNLPDQDRKPFNMKDSIGTKLLVVFFYPKGENLLCTKELCAFSDSIAAFNKAGALVIGISGSDINDLKKFCQKHSLHYNLLSDSTGTVLSSFGVKENLLSDRVTYVINIAGKVVFKSYSKTDGKKHVHEVLKFLREMN
jgi:peroxiredoxin Q/BCP